MKINENIIKGKWREIKGDVQKAWGKLTDDELEKTKGDLKSIGGLIQKNYGESQANYDKKLSEIVKRYEEKKDEKVETIKKKLKS